MYSAADTALQQLCDRLRIDPEFFAQCLQASVIEIYENRSYARVNVIPIRDPIIGPIKAAYRVSTGQLVLVGATARGVVIATLPNTFTTTCP